MNCSKDPDFVLSGMSSDPDKPQLLFGLFLALYLLSLLGNSPPLLAIVVDIHFHTPMYFLSQHSLVDLWFTTTTAPKTLEALWTSSGLIFFECLAQFFCTFC